VCYFRKSALKIPNCSIGLADFGILRRVIRPTRNPLLYCLFAVLFVIVRTADAHAHFCFDGKEPPASVHIADGDVHPCESDEGSGHTGDKDVKLTPDALLKKASAEDVWLPAMVYLGAYFLAQPSIEPPPAYAQVNLPPAPYLFLPPLRGPPA
jgi:hypothetical protein